MKGFPRKKARPEPNSISAMPIATSLTRGKRQMKPVQAALRVNVLFLAGAALAVFLWWAFRNTKAGLILRVVGDSADAPGTAR
jgi:ABC-type uncharacterized transport system permease subunit